MMKPWWMWCVLTLVIAVSGGFYLLFPSISRRGLLFGVYVGEEVWAGPEARKITASWYRGMLLWMLAALISGLGLSFFFQPVAGFIAAAVFLSGGFLAEYLRAYYRARSLAAPVSAPDVAAPDSVGQKPLLLPWLAIVVGFIGGVYAIYQAASQWELVPSMVPTHFGFSGKPDAWKPRSFGTVMGLPLMTLVLGAGLGAVSLLIGGAKRALRHPDQGISLAAQLRFRRAMAHFLALVALLTTGLMTTLADSSLRVAIKEADRISPVVMISAFLLMLVAIGGSLFIALRFGQGGARLERQAGNAPLTNGLADNRRWYLGMFYVNREDPALFIERRFGLGYTINFGNPRVIGFILFFILFIVVIQVMSS